MRIGMVGLGRMGSNLTRRLMRHGHEVVAFDADAAAVEALAGEGAIAAASLQALLGALEPPRTVWIMIPAALAGDVADTLVEAMDPGDVVIDGGNSYYRDDVERAGRYGARGVHLLDVGTSGGVHGLERGFCLMVGGPADVVERLDPIFAALAPGVDAATRTPGRTGAAATAEAGYLHCGPSGAGHFVKMVHNGIEYGLMAAYAEGLNVLKHADAGALERRADAETAPLRDADAYRYDLDVAQIAEVWRRGSVVSSWLLDLAAAALWRDPDLEGLEGHVADSGEGRWTIQAAVDEGVPAHVLSAALFERFASRGRADFASRALSAMRREFGGHVEGPQP
ncbi:MAG TPA: decarboxylating 6-phosphogluconate dehydrogenase [Actinomycetota bacterium]|nr:decarboxylating 6-phosphogluconate dehydrogenase [Actinomycetota bacterium]